MKLIELFPAIVTRHNQQLDGHRAHSCMKEVDLATEPVAYIYRLAIGLQTKTLSMRSVDGIDWNVFLQFLYLVSNCLYCYRFTNLQCHTVIAKGMLPEIRPVI
jgi:hypothetical protein